MAQRDVRCMLCNRVSVYMRVVCCATPVRKPTIQAWRCCDNRQSQQHADGDKHVCCRYAEREAAAQSSLAAMGLGPSTNGFGAGPSHAAPQGNYAAMFPQESVHPPPPYQGPKHPPHNPPPNVNAYGQPIPPEPAQSAVGHFLKGTHPQQPPAGSFQDDFFIQATHANGSSYQQAQHDYSPHQAVPSPGNWEKQLWEADPHKHNADYSWIQLQQRQQRHAMAGTDFLNGPVQRPRGQHYEQMPAVRADYTASQSAPAKPASIVPQEEDLDVDALIQDFF